MNSPETKSFVEDRSINNNNNSINNNNNLFPKARLKLKVALLPSFLFEYFKRRFLSSSLFCNNKVKFTPKTATRTKSPSKLQTGFYYLEGPRFHNGYLYVSDMHNAKVYKIDPHNGNILLTIPFQDKVSGLGWLSTGEMLVVAMNSMQIIKYDEQSQSQSIYADLSPYCRYRANDMVVDVDDHVYVGNFGFDVDDMFSVRYATLVHVNPHQHVSLAAKDLLFPNGCLITPDGKTLIVAESFSGCLTAFDIDREEDKGEDNHQGRLTNRRIWADVGVVCDGICLDEEGCVWAAVPQLGAYHTCGYVLRVAEHGEIKDCYGFKCNGLSAQCIATNLYTDNDNDDNDDERGESKEKQSWLYVMEAKTFNEGVLMKKHKTKNSWITKIPVSVGPAKRQDDPRYHAGMC